MRKPITAVAFVLALRRQWIAAMSGGAGVPFAVAAVLLENTCAQFVFAALSIAAAWLAAYRIWSAERDSTNDALAREAQLILRLADSELRRAAVSALGDALDRANSLAVRPVQTPVENEQVKTDFIDFCESLSARVGHYIVVTELSVLAARAPASATQRPDSFNDEHNDIRNRLEAIAEQLHTWTGRYLADACADRHCTAAKKRKR